MELLARLYKAFSPSKKEGEVQKIILDFLNTNKIPYKIDSYGQIYSVSKTRPVLSAHMDQVSTKPIKKLTISKNKISADGNLGADDKNGVWIALKALESNPKLGFHFSVQEESGGVPFHPDIEKTPYVLVFDRKGSSDIIGYSNGYCSKAFQDLVYANAKPYGYRPASGVYSDCDQFSGMGIPCVNLSCGYYSAHTEKEYTILPELYNALDVALHLIKTIPKKRNKDWEPEPYLDTFGVFGRYEDEQKCDICGQWEYKEFLKPLMGYPGTLVCEDCKQYFEQGAKP